MKNTMANLDPKAQKSTKVMPAVNPNPVKTNLKTREDGERADLRKREHKSLMKSLTMA